MNRNEFFNEIMDEIAYIPEKDLQNIISYYDSLFESELLKGKTEDEIIKSFGDWKSFINKLKSPSQFDSYGKKFEKSSKTKLVAEDESTQNLFSKETDIENNLHTYVNNPKKETASTSDVILKLAILASIIIIILPISSALIGFILGLFGTSLGLFTGSLGLLISSSLIDLSSVQEIPAFLQNLPHLSLVFFCLGTMCLGILMFLLLFYLSKITIIFFKRFFFKILP